MLASFYLDDIEDGKLEDGMMIETYAWNVGYMNYVRV